MLKLGAGLLPQACLQRLASCVDSALASRGKLGTPVGQEPESAGPAGRTWDTIPWQGNDGAATAEGREGSLHQK